MLHENDTRDTLITILALSNASESQNYSTLWILTYGLLTYLARSTEQYRYRRRGVIVKGRFGRCGDRNCEYFTKSLCSGQQSGGYWEKRLFVRLCSMSQVQKLFVLEIAAIITVKHGSQNRQAVWWSILTSFVYRLGHNYVVNITETKQGKATVITISRLSFAVAVAE